MGNGHVSRRLRLSRRRYATDYLTASPAQLAKTSWLMGPGESCRSISVVPFRHKHDCPYH